MIGLVASLLFVLIWSTGFIVARAVVPHGAPELVLAIRLGATTCLLAGAAAFAGQSWPRGRWLQIVFF